MRSPWSPIRPAGIVNLTAMLAEGGLLIADQPIAAEGLEALPQRFVILPADPSAVKAFVAEHAHA